ncbi:MAG: UTP--glucose-1-phosphate uridylyltransferase, partial [Candidatus Thermoplasmatota archaeon]
RIAEMANIHFVRQREQRGLGHAILCAKQHIGNEPFAVLLGDDVTFSGVPCTKQLIERFRRREASIVAVEHVPPERIESYGVVKVGPETEPALFPIDRLVEKPSRADAPSDLGILGRYVLTGTIFEELERTPPGRNGEIQLTDALQRLRAREEMFAYAFEGRRYDLGDKLEWLKTNIEVALSRPEFGDDLRAFLKRLGG